MWGSGFNLKVEQVVSGNVALVYNRSMLKSLKFQILERIIKIVKKNTQTKTYDLRTRNRLAVLILRSCTQC